MKYRLTKREFFNACMYMAGRRMTGALSKHPMNILRGSLKECNLILENGVLILERDGSRLEFPAFQVSRVIQKKDLLLILLEERLGQGLCLILPKRIFSVPGDMDAFLKTLAEAAGQGAGIPEQEDTEALHAFSFFMDGELLIRIQALLSLEQTTGRRAKNRASIQRKAVRKTRNRLSKGKLHKMLGTWQTAFYGDHVRVRLGEREDVIGYDSFQKLLVSPDLYLFSGGLCGNSFGLPVQAVPSEKREEFLDFCRCRMPLEQTEGLRIREKKLSGASRTLLIFMILIVLGAGITLGLQILEEGSNPKNHVEDRSPSEYDEDFVFRPEEYPDYLSIEEQIGVLEELGFEIPEGAADYYHGWMDQSEYGKLYVEGYPYYMLLSDLGAPDYDMDTWQFLGYSGQVYWFDYESWDISSNYVEILEGVQALTDEEVEFIGAREDCTDVNWRKGTGTIRVTFWYGGHPHEFQANVDGDWLDPDFVPFLNEVLEQEGAKKRIYSCPDNDQGCILFYQDEDWVREFTSRTGLELEEL